MPPSRRFRMGFAHMRTLLVLVVAVAFASPVWAQTPPATAPVLNELYACAGITDAAGRLACYDGATARLRQAESQGQVAVVDRARAQELARESFGFQLPNLSRLLSGGGHDQPVQNIQASVSRVMERPNGYHAFVLDNGQVWAQIEPQGVRNVRAGDSVRIQRATLGSFRLISSRGGAGHRVRREN